MPIKILFYSNIVEDFFFKKSKIKNKDFQNQKREEIECKFSDFNTLFSDFFMLDWELNFNMIENPTKLKVTQMKKS